MGRGARGVGGLVRATPPLHWLGVLSLSVGLRPSGGIREARVNISSLVVKCMQDTERALRSATVLGCVPACAQHLLAEVATASSVCHPNVVACLGYHLRPLTEQRAAGKACAASPAMASAASSPAPHSASSGSTCAAVVLRVANPLHPAAAPAQATASCSPPHPARHWPAKAQMGKRTAPGSTDTSTSSPSSPPLLASSGSRAEGSGPRQALGHGPPSEDHMKRGDAPLGGVPTSAVQGMPTSAVQGGTSAGTSCTSAAWRVCMVFEFCNGGTLRECIEAGMQARSGPGAWGKEEVAEAWARPDAAQEAALSPPRAATHGPEAVPEWQEAALLLAWQVAAGMAYLHGMGMVSGACLHACFSRCHSWTCLTHFCWCGAAAVVLASACMQGCGICTCCWFRSKAGTHVCGCMHGATRACVHACRCMATSAHPTCCCTA